MFFEAHAAPHDQHSTKHQHQLRMMKDVIFLLLFHLLCILIPPTSTQGSRGTPIIGRTRLESGGGGDESGQGGGQQEQRGVILSGRNGAVSDDDGSLRLVDFFRDDELPHLLSLDIMDEYFNVTQPDQPCGACEEDGWLLYHLLKEEIGLVDVEYSNATSWCDWLREKRIIGCVEVTSIRGSDNTTQDFITSGYFTIIDHLPECSLRSFSARSPSTPLLPTTFPPSFFSLSNNLAIIIRGCAKLGGRFFVPPSDDSSKLRIVWLTKLDVWVEEEGDLEGLGSYEGLWGVSIARTGIRWVGERMREWID